MILLFPLSVWLGRSEFFTFHFLDLFFFSFLVQGLLICLAFIYQVVPDTAWGFPDKTTLRRIVAYSGVALLGNLIFFSAIPHRLLVYQQYLPGMHPG